MRFLIPSVASTIALSLNQFADSIIVAQLLGSSAMSVVNLGVPIVMAFAVVYMLFGTGGSVLYANYLGKMEKKKAGGVFSFTLLSAFVVSALVACVGIVFNESLSGIPFDHVSADQEQYGNIWMIKKISTDFKYDYLLGLNQTVIKLATQKI